jgi:hypothetical protein
MAVSSRVLLGRPLRLLRPIVAIAALSLPAVAPAQSVAPLLGTWSGQGTVVITDGKSEAIKCNSYVTGGGSDLRYVIRCASPGYKIEIRSALKKDGRALSGQWEERTYNAAGDAKGQIDDGKISLAVTGGGFTGQMNVTYTAEQQTVVVTTAGIAMKSLRMRLAKAGS